VLVEILDGQIKGYFHNKRLKENLEEKHQTREAVIHEHSLKLLEKNMKNLVQSICKIGNVGFGYKRMLTDLSTIKVLCLSLNPKIPLVVTHQVWVQKSSENFDAVFLERTRTSVQTLTP